jgi:hypothetical protein
VRIGRLLLWKYVNALKLKGYKNKNTSNKNKTSNEKTGNSNCCSVKNLKLGMQLLLTCGRF